MRVGPQNISGWQFDPIPPFWVSGQATAGVGGKEGEVGGDPTADNFGKAATGWRAKIMPSVLLHSPHLVALSTQYFFFLMVVFHSLSLALAHLPGYL